MSFDDVPIRPAPTSAAAFAVPLGILDNVPGGSTASSAPKPPKPFLRRNTGLQTRLLASREKP